MTKRMIAAQLSVGALLLVLVALMESYTGWDTAAQRLWFDSATHEWVVSNELHARLTWFFYDGPKILLVVLGIACVAGVLAAHGGICRRNAAGVLAAAPQSGLLSRCCSAVQNSSPTFIAPSRSRSSGANTSIRACWNAGTPANEGRSPAGVSRQGARFGRFCAHDAVLFASGRAVTGGPVWGPGLLRAGVWDSTRCCGDSISSRTRCSQ